MGKRDRCVTNVGNEKTVYLEAGGAVHDPGALRDFVLEKTAGI